MYSCVTTSTHHVDVYSCSRFFCSALSFARRFPCVSGRSGRPLGLGLGASGFTPPPPSFRLLDDDDAGLLAAAASGSCPDTAAAGAGAIPGGPCDETDAGRGEDGTYDERCALAPSSVCGRGDVGADATWVGVAVPPGTWPFISRSSSAFSSSDIMVVATDVISFISEISPICAQGQL